MADNVEITPGSGAIIASEEVDGRHYQYVKLAFGGVDAAKWVDELRPIPVVDRASAYDDFQGRACTFRTPGRAGTTGQKLLTLWNTATSTKLVRINSIRVDLNQTVIKAVTVIPPIIRVHRINSAPTAGTTLGKVSKDQRAGQGSTAGVVVQGDASADGVQSGSALAATIPIGQVLSQEYAPRLITAVGHEPADRIDLLSDRDVILQASEGIAVTLDYTLEPQNPTTDMWIATVDWTEWPNSLGF